MATGKTGEVETPRGGNRPRRRGPPGDEEKGKSETPTKQAAVGEVPRMRGPGKSKPNRGKGPGEDPPEEEAQK